MTRKQAQDAFFIVLLVGLSAAFIRLLAPYLVAVAVAVILALLLRHPLNWLLRRGVARGAATALVVVALLDGTSVQSGFQLEPPSALTRN